MAEQFNAYRERIKGACSLPAKTIDGQTIKVQANVAWQEDILDVSKNGGEGVGLYRTEFAFLNRATPPDEEELYLEYARAMRLVPEEVCFRTLDLGADKIMPDLSYQVEANPALGLRGIRYCLSNPDLFKVQLRALLRAAGSSRPCRASVMFPMLADPLEFKRSIRALQEARRELRDQGLPCAEDIPAGVMIELPAAALLAGVLAEEADFFSIGTNDLTQYTLAMDRMHPLLANQTDAMHPAVLQLIDMTVKAALAHGKWVGVCGGAAGEVAAAKVLVGLGVRELSMSPPQIAVVKQALRQYRLDELQDLAQRVLAQGSSKAVRDILREHA